MMEGSFDIPTHPDHGTALMNDTHSNGKDAPPKSKNLGRAGRRRRRKLMEIAQAEQAWRNNHTVGDSSSLPLSSSTSAILPDDRHFIWPAVTTVRQALGWNAPIVNTTTIANDNNKDDSDNSNVQYQYTDEQWLVSQLGYVPGNAIQVTCRLHQVFDDALSLLSGHAHEPVVIQLYPLALRCRKSPLPSSTQQTKESHDQGDATIDRINPPNDSGSKKRKVKGVASHNDNDTINTTKIATDTNAAMQEPPDTEMEPFPTMYWLTHGLLSILISKLEVQGLGIALEQRLQEQPESLESMQHAHQAYGHARWNSLTADDQTWITATHNPWLQKALDPTRGVAGIRNPAAVKCLHAHAAHCLSRSMAAASHTNVIGRWVLQAVHTMLQPTPVPQPMIALPTDNDNSPLDDIHGNTVAPAVDDIQQQTYGNNDNDEILPEDNT
jgi:hypothetical protein